MIGDPGLELAELTHGRIMLARRYGHELVGGVGCVGHHRWSNRTWVGMKNSNDGGHFIARRLMYLHFKYAKKTTHRKAIYQERRVLRDHCCHEAL